MKERFIPLALVLSGCAVASLAPQEPRSQPGSSATLPDVAGVANALVVEAASCWFGGLWSDAEGLAPDVRRASAEKRCDVLVGHVYSPADPTPAAGPVNARERQDHVRAAAPDAVERLARAIERAASDERLDARKKTELLDLFRALATAQRESDAAHAAVEAVKRDIDDAEQREHLAPDEVAAVAPLLARTGLDALASPRAAELTAQARLFTVLVAMDRLQMARGLTKHLKVYAVAEPLRAVFGVAPPIVPADATAKLVPGVWLDYLTRVAAAAKHPVPAAAASAREREPWAWGGVLEGFSDALKADAAALPSELQPIARTLAGRLDAEWAEVPAIAATQRTIAEQEAKSRAR